LDFLDDQPEDSMQGRKFTWSSAQEEPPILARLDKVLFNTQWEDVYPISDLIVFNTRSLTSAFSTQFEI
jgi:hypothetical protein